MRFEYPAKRLSIQRDMSKDAICVLMSEGNKTVYNILVMCAQVDPQLLLLLDSMNIRGAQVFAGFLGYCEGFFPRFKTCVESRDQQMIDYINQKVPQLKAMRDRFQIKSR